MKRRQILTGLALAPLAALLPRFSPEPALADGSASGEAAQKNVDYLFVQNAKSAKLKDGVLTLKDVNAQTIYFVRSPGAARGTRIDEGFRRQLGPRGQR